MTELCVILGNGPSLKGFDLTRLNGVTSLGMNAAYRYWDQIGWYPTYYACLDDQLMITHHDEIYRLWSTGTIKTFFLHGSFFDYHPDCIGAEGVYSLDQVSAYWYRRRARKTSWDDLSGTDAFHTSDTTKVTTGSYAVRFAAWMGHKSVAIMGVDLKYVEILPEAKTAGGVALVMKETPKENPNYFFDDYQQEGDKFNIPNPAQHDNALHIRSFELIAEDYADKGLDVRIFNTNPNSLLEDTKTFPLCPIDRILDAPGLSGVVVPTNVHEVSAIVENFRIWADPAQAPLTPHQQQAGGGLCPLMLVFNNDSAKPQEAAIRAAFEASGMARYFSQLDIRYLDLTGKDDRYQRDYSQKVGEEGYKSGPNNQFFLTLQAGADLGGYVFHMETDCVPLRAGWLAGLDMAVRATAAPFWIMGSRYHGVETLSPDFVNHLNGNAIYAAHDPAFVTFVETVWAPWTRKLVAGTDKRLAYDCILEKLFTCHRDVPEIAAAAQQAAPYLVATTSVVNLSGQRDLQDLPDTYARDMLARFPQAWVLHNRTGQRMAAARIAKHDRLEAMAQRPRARLLVLDMTVMGNGTATGELKSTLLNGWPQDRMMQVAMPGPNQMVVVRPDGAGFAQTPLTAKQIHEAIKSFDPQVILYRPLADRPALHDLAMTVLNQRPDTPLITWIMDDWPARLQADDPALFAKLDTDLRELLKRSALRLSICDAMSAAYQTRYGLPFRAMANGIDTHIWSDPRMHQDGPVVLRYAGGLAPDMNAQALQRIAHAVEDRRAEGQDIRFEISTRPFWKDTSGHLFDGLEGTALLTQTMPFADYVRWLETADALVIAYNFDSVSQRYVRYSMANKMPECLASGAAVLVHGPRGVATVDYLAANGVADIVDTPDPEALKDALLRLGSPGWRRIVGRAGRARAVAAHDLANLRCDLVDAIETSMHTPPDTAKLYPTVTPPASHPPQAVMSALSDTQTDLEAEIARLQDALRDKESELQKIYASKSWKLTGGLRGMRRTLSGSK